MTRRDPLLDRALFGWGRRRRYTQDSPVPSEVWLAFGKDPERPVDLLLTPNRSTSAGRLASVLRSRLDAYRAPQTRRPPHRTAYTQSTVASTLTLAETAAKLLTGRVEPGEGEDQLLWSADCNRPAEPAVYKSTLAVKADAGRRLFDFHRQAGAAFALRTPIPDELSVPVALWR